MSFAARLNEIRNLKKRSLQEVADAIGVSKTHIWELEKGRTENPSLELLRKLSDYFGVSIRHLVGEDFENKQDDQLARMFRQVAELEESDRGFIDEMITTLKARREKDAKDRQVGN